jgi:NAD-dependent DNA ligase
LRDNGGKVGSSISAKTDYVIAGIIWVNQIRKANKLNVSIISEDDFMNLIQ